MVLHPIYDRLLERFSTENALDVRSLREMIAGTRPAPAAVVDLIASMLDVPKSAWAKRTKSGPVVPASTARHSVRVTAAQQALKGAGRRRKNPSRVHEVLDKLGWTVAVLAVRISEELGKPTSRPSVQNWASGERSITHRGDAKVTPVCAPLDVRQAAERVTLAEAQKKRLGPDAVLRASDWPNVPPGE